METSKLYMKRMRQVARAHLHPNFAQLVIEQSERLGRARLQLRLIAVTAAVCAMTAVSFQWAWSDLAQQRNLEAWSQTAAQARVLVESI